VWFYPVSPSNNRDCLKQTYIPRFAFASPKLRVHRFHPSSIIAARDQSGLNRARNGLLVHQPSCKAPSGVLSRAAQAIGVEVVAHAQGSCSPDGYCYGCSVWNGTDIFSAPCGGPYCGSGSDNTSTASNPASYTGYSPSGYGCTGDSTCACHYVSCECPY